MLACDHQLRRGQPDRGGVVITVLPQPLNRAGVSSAHGSSQFLRQPAKLACIATLRQSLLRPDSTVTAAPGFPQPWEMILRRLAGVRA